ncbi:hypothetical protein TcCL_NonESM12865 [Trypanosoma cruzi]|nr:hypothetical protein TcCL_NonESM12865 [Trypanosoma cruzi]
MWAALASAPIQCAPHGTARGHLSCTPIFFILQPSPGTLIWALQCQPPSFRCRPIAPNSGVLLPLQRGSNGLRVPRHGDSCYRVSQRGAIHPFVLAPPCNEFAAR